MVLFNTDGNIIPISFYRLYNLYNEEACILDFRQNTSKRINSCLIVNTNNYMDVLEEFPPDNLNNIVLIVSPDIDIIEITHNINMIYSFKKYHCFEDKNMHKLYTIFPFIFNGTTQTYPSLIIPLFPKKVFLGSVKNVTEDFLQESNIDTIINMSFVSLNTSIEHSFPIDDDETTHIEDILDITYSIIDKAQNILVVCQQGKSRSVSVVLYYYIKKYNLSISKGLFDLKNCRSICNPNSGFLRQINKKINN